MSLKRYSSELLLSQENNSDETLKHIKTPFAENFCQVCGDKAKIINYGALSCQSCKTFFRRNGFHPESVRSCFFNRSCEINVNTRRNCTACRLAKCLSIGMSPDLIRKEIKQRKKIVLSKNAHIHQNNKCKQSVSILKQPLTNRPYSDQSSLNKYERTLLSNIIHAHDIFSATLQIRHTVKECCASFSFHTSFNVSNVLEIITLMYTSMESFINSSPDFRILSIHEQYSLLERNLHGVIALCSVLLYRLTGIIDNPKCLQTFSIIYGLETMLQANSIDAQLDPDVTIIKIILIVLAFSSNCFMIVKREEIQMDGLVNGTFRLFGSQNAYVELLWKYMIYHYGHFDTVIRYSRLMRLVLYLIKHSSYIYTSNQFYSGLVDDILAQIKQSLITSQHIQKPLWGKT